MSISKSSGTQSGFVAQNSGKISHCFSYGKMENLTGGFIGNGTTGIDDSNSFFYNDLKKKEPKIRKLQDSHLGQSIESIKSDLDLKKLGYDFDKVFQYKSNDSIPVSFISDEWMYDIKQSKRFEEYKEMKPLTLSSKEEFIEFVQKVNNGDHDSQNAYVILNNDINLNGMEWKPIGIDKLTAFSGIFDGAGHTISNFIIKDKKGEVSGLFGYLCGEVYNLTVDGKIAGGKNSGGIAGICQGGIIGCCASVVDIKVTDGIIGGLAALNTGTIFKCYSAGKIQSGVTVSKLIMLPLILLLMVVSAFAIQSILTKPDNLSKFQQVPYDEDCVAIDDDGDVEMVEGSNYVSFQFTKDVEVNLSTGKCKFDFKNPGSSNHDVVVELQMTDAQAIRIMGSTGRTTSEQEKLEKNPSYNPENYRMVLAKSGAIAPGNMLENLTLIEQANGAMLPDGTYNAVIYLYYYDVKTNTKAMLDTQFPVVLTVSR